MNYTTNLNDIPYNSELFGSFKTFSKYSDIRLKTDIKLIGISEMGINMYSFKYNGSEDIYQGVMAQEVPWATTQDKHGFYMVDYSKVDVEFKKLN